MPDISTEILCKRLTLIFSVKPTGRAGVQRIVTAPDEPSLVLKEDLRAMLETHFLKTTFLSDSKRASLALQNAGIAANPDKRQLEDLRSHLYYTVQLQTPPAYDPLDLAALRDLLVTEKSPIAKVFGDSETRSVNHTRNRSLYFSIKHGSSRQEVSEFLSANRDELLQLLRAIEKANDKKAGYRLADTIVAGRGSSTADTDCKHGEPRFSGKPMR